MDRTCHISYKAIEPPGQAWPDLDIFLDYSRRMGFKDKDGNELMPWTEPEQVFDAWKRSSAGRPCDYSGMSYAKLTGGSGIQWPCNAATSPDGTERLFSDWTFFTDIDYCESYGHDLETGSAYTVDEYRAMNPAGRAFLKCSHYKPSEEMPNEQYPLRLSTGRVVYHFHTRTKTGRDKHLAQAGGDSYCQISTVDAKQYGIEDGDMVVVESVRGAVEVPAKVGDIEQGQVFLPFHFGSHHIPRTLTKLLVASLSYNHRSLPVAGIVDLCAGIGMTRQVAAELATSLLRPAGIPSPSSRCSKEVQCVYAKLRASPYIDSGRRLRRAMRRKRRRSRWPSRRAPRSTRRPTSSSRPTSSPQ